MELAQSDDDTAAIVATIKQRIATGDPTLALLPFEYSDEQLERIVEFMSREFLAGWDGHTRAAN